MSALAFAQAERTVRVDYSGAPGCPGPREFADQLQSRSRRIHVADGGGSVDTLIVRVDARGGKFAGRLTLRTLDGRETERTVTGDSCSEVVRGLALVAAIALDPGAALSPVAESTPASEAAAFFFNS